jgi:hypothetical protein
MGPRLRVGLREEDGEVSFVDVIWGSGEVGKWRSGEVEKWSSGEVEKWRSGEVEKWRSGEVEKWRSGEVEKWRSGELIYGGGWCTDKDSKDERNISVYRNHLRNETC